MFRKDLKTMKQEIPAAIAKRLKTNFILRMVLAVALVVLWGSPVVLRVISGGSISLNELYSGSWTAFSSGSLALIAGYLTLLFTRNKLRRDALGEAAVKPVATAAASN
jgi:hypothetical protein